MSVMNNRLTETCSTSLILDTPVKTRCPLYLLYHVTISRGWGIGVFYHDREAGHKHTRGDSRAIDTRVWMILSGRTRPLSKTGLSVRD